MSKRKFKKNFHFSVPVPPPDVMFPIFAQDFKRAERALLPMIIRDKARLDPVQALVLVALKTNHAITNNPNMGEERLVAATKLLWLLWERGFYTPGPDYPYTLEETRACFENGVQG